MADDEAREFVQQKRNNPKVGPDSYFWGLLDTLKCFTVLQSTVLYFVVLVDNFGYFWVLGILLSMFLVFGYFFITFVYFRGILGTLGYFWVLVGILGYFWVIFRVFCFNFGYFQNINCWNGRNGWKLLKMSKIAEKLRKIFEATLN